MLEPDKVDALARKLKELAKAQRDSLKAADRSAAYDGPRTGPRGGKRTTLEARWMTLAEYRDRVWREVIEEARTVLGI